ncbi:hypothetical protein ACHAWF_002406 [Thalassiosira exigua]
MWDTNVMCALVEQASHLAETVIDVTSSESTRQCWIDASTALVKLLEGLHTPKLKALLDQLAVSAYRLANVLSSGQGKSIVLRPRGHLVCLDQGGKQSSHGVVPRQGTR